MTNSRTINNTTRAKIKLNPEEEREKRRKVIYCNSAQTVLIVWLLFRDWIITTATMYLPVRMYVTTAIANRDRPMDNTASVQMVKYCS